MAGDTVTPAADGGAAPAPEHNLTKNWKEENMTVWVAMMMVVCTAIWAFVAFSVKPDCLGFIGIVGVFSSVQWMPYLMALIYYNGLYKKLAYAPLTAKVPKWVDRAKVAHNNALENFMLFAISVFFALQSGVKAEAINFWCLFYFICRYVPPPPAHAHTPARRTALQSFGG